jgi:hypothetical protein
MIFVGKNHDQFVYSENVLPASTSKGQIDLCEWKRKDFRVDVAS